jgi:hypothetical protein
MKALSQQNGREKGSQLLDSLYKDGWYKNCSTNTALPERTTGVNILRNDNM